MGRIDRGSLPADIKIRNDLKPGDIGYLTYLHGKLYAEECGWDYTFEAYVADPLARFARARSERERIWIVEKDQVVSGSVGIVEASGESAQLRWLLLHPGLRGHGVGRLLVEEAVAFCRASGYSSIFLWTVSTLGAAAGLYRSAGFRLTEEHTHEMWGATVTEQRYEASL
ncbi:MAG TPA: GNAT family N-acetyltransferase [Blastocatellia bacterium]|nr:GNAT family N-acetyltransferase [Blastocatellia bacterium]